MPHYLPTDNELELSAIRAQGAGGQNVNKVSSAIHLRFNIAASGLPPAVKARLLALPDRRIDRDGWLTIKAQRHRTQERNRLDALARLGELIDSVWRAPPVRRATAPSRAARRRRTDEKTHHGRVKRLRAAPHED